MDDPNQQYDVPEREPPSTLSSGEYLLSQRDNVREGLMNIVGKAMEGTKSYRDAVQYGKEEGNRSELPFEA